MTRQRPSETSTVNLSPLHRLILWHLAYDPGSPAPMDALMRGVWGVYESVRVDDPEEGEVRICLLEMEFLGLTKVEPVSAKWSITDLGRVMLSKSPPKQNAN